MAQRHHGSQCGMSWVMEREDERKWGQRGRSQESTAEQERQSKCGPSGQVRRPVPKGGDQPSHFTQNAPDFSQLTPHIPGSIQSQRNQDIGY